MKTDYLDHYYAHRYDNLTPLKEVISSINNLIDEGKIRYGGTSHWAPAELERAHAICEGYGYEGPIVDQITYNMFMNSFVRMNQAKWWNIKFPTLLSGFTKLSSLVYILN